MDDKSEALKTLLKHTLFASPFLVGGILMMPITSPKRGIDVFLGIMLLMAAAGILARPLFNLFATSFGSLIFPHLKTNKVNLMFSIPETRVMEGKYEEALQLYRKMIPEDPKRLEIYLRIMKLGANQMEQPELVIKTFREGLKNLEDLRDRKVLAIEYRELMSSLRNN